MEVVHRLLIGLHRTYVPDEFLHIYLSNCIRSCELIDDRSLQSRQVRLVSWASSTFFCVIHGCLANVLPPCDTRYRCLYNHCYGITLSTFRTFSLKYNHSASSSHVIEEQRLSFALWQSKQIIRTSY
jgi:hypothetical protein